jgi:hypothetical protein
VTIYLRIRVREGEEERKRGREEERKRGREEERKRGREEGARGQFKALCILWLLEKRI